MNLVTARFYDRVGGPTEPMSFEPAVTCALAALPGAQVELATRHVKVPPLSSSTVGNLPSRPALDAKDPYKDDPFRD